MSLFIRSAPAGVPRRVYLRVLLLLLCACFAACAGRSANVQRYDLKGKVVSVDRPKGEVTIDHEEIAGYMPAMTMDYPLPNADTLKVIEGGDQIQATLVVADDGRYWLENPVITKGKPGDAKAAQTVGGAEPQPGAEVPDVKLVNQGGKSITVRQFKGRALLLTFVYTRCPLPDYCPLMSANFAQINGALQTDSDLRGKAHLLSVTLDPEYDKPDVLRKYGASYAGGKFDTWDFATGDPAEVRRLAEFFGLIYQKDKDQVIHSLRTAIVTPDGRLYKVYRGNEWKPDDVLRDLKEMLSKG